jgi:hypothetical protein
MCQITGPCCCVRNQHEITNKPIDVSSAVSTAICCAFHTRTSYRQKNSRKRVRLFERGFISVAAQGEGGCLFVLRSVRALRMCAWLAARSRNWRRPPKPPFPLRSAYLLRLASLASGQSASSSGETPKPPFSRCARPGRCVWCLMANKGQGVRG